MHDTIGECILKCSLEKEIQSMPPKLRYLLYHHYYDGYAVSTIATLLGISEGTVKGMLCRARRCAKLIFASLLSYTNVSDDSVL